MLASDAGRPGTTDLRFSEMSRRLDGQDKILDKIDASEQAILAIVNRIEKTQIETTEQLRARSEANHLAIEQAVRQQNEDRKSSVARDEQTVSLIREEHQQREKAMSERKSAHDNDIAGLRSDIKAVDGKVESLKDKVSDAVTLSRVQLFVLAALVVAVIGAIVTGHFSLVVHP